MKLNYVNDFLSPSMYSHGTYRISEVSVERAYALCSLALDKNGHRRMHSNQSADFLQENVSFPIKRGNG